MTPNNLADYPAASGDAILEREAPLHSLLGDGHKLSVCNSHLLQKPVVTLEGAGRENQILEFTSTIKNKVNRDVIYG